MRFILLFFIFTFSIGLIAQTPTSWNNSRGDAQLKGFTPVNFPQKVKLKWTFKAEGSFKSAPVIADGKIVVGSTNGELLCIDLNGKLLWKFKAGNSIEAPALIEDGVVYMGDLSGSLFALDLKTGNKKWEYKTENQIMGAPAITTINGKLIIAVGSYDYNLHGVDALTGKGLWKYESGNYVNSAPAVSNGNALFGGCDGFLHIVNMKDGSLKGKIEVATYVPSSPAVADNKAYIGDYDGGISCIDLGGKKSVWRYQKPDSGLPFIASPSIVDNKLLIGSRDKFIYCFDQKEGKLLWKKNTGNPIDASTVVNKKQVLLVNMRGDLMLLNLSDGTTVWTYELGVGVANTPAVIQNTIVVAGTDGNVYFLGQ